MDLKFSIIMPVYKTEAFVEQSIQSVLAQTYCNYELICVNDATPDKAAIICQNYAKKYPEKIKVVNSSPSSELIACNRGIEATRNRGLEESSGEFILFLDSDDTLVNNTLEVLERVISLNTPDIVMFSFSKIIKGQDYPIILPEHIEGMYSHENLVDMLLNEISLSVLCCIGSKLYRTSFLREKNIWFDRKYKYNEDAGFILESLLEAKNIYVLPNAFYKYLIRESDSTMSSYKPDMFSSTVKAREIIKLLFDKNQAWDNDHEYRYYHELLALINGCLINEIKFGTRESYKNEFKKIRVYKDFDNMTNCLLSHSSLFSKQHLLVLAMKNNLSYMVRLALERTL